jgi:hypothetical protein
MSTPFGPWCTGIDAQSSPHLSTFWTRRMAMLPELAAHPGPPTRRQALLAGLSGLGLACWPTLRPGRAVEAAPIPDDTEGRLYLYAGFKLYSEKEMERQAKEKITDEAGIIAVDPESGEWDVVFPGLLPIFSGSPDGKTIASGEVEIGDMSMRLTNVMLFDVERPDMPPRTICEFGSRAVWSGDGLELIVSRPTTEPGQVPGRGEHWRMDADGTNRVKLPVPASHAIMDWSPDGRWITTASPEHPDARGNHVYLMRPDGTDLRRMSTEDVSTHARFSPDGRRLAFVERQSIVIVDIDGGNRRQFRPSDAPDPSYTGVAWSPDGRRLACITEDWDRVVERKRLSNGRILIMDIEDGTARTLRIPEAIYLGWLHWLPKS